MAFSQMHLRVEVVEKTIGVIISVILSFLVWTLSDPQTTPIKHANPEGRKGANSSLGAVVLFSHSYQEILNLFKSLR